MVYKAIGSTKPNRVKYVGQPFFSFGEVVTAFQMVQMHAAHSRGYPKLSDHFLEVLEI